HQHANDQEPAESWEIMIDHYRDAVEALGGDEPCEEEDRPRSPRHTAKVRATVLELSRLHTFLAGEGIRLSDDTIGRLVDILEADLLAALSLLRRRADGDYRPDRYRERFPQSMAIIPSNVKLA